MHWKLKPSLYLRAHPQAEATPAILCFSLNFHKGGKTGKFVLSSGLNQQSGNTGSFQLSSGKSELLGDSGKFVLESGSSDTDGNSGLVNLKSGSAVAATLELTLQSGNSDRTLREIYSFLWHINY